MAIFYKSESLLGTGVSFANNLHEYLQNLSVLEQEKIDKDLRINNKK